VVFLRLEKCSQGERNLEGFWGAAIPLPGLREERGKLRNMHAVGYKNKNLSQSFPTGQKGGIEKRGKPARKGLRDTHQPRSLLPVVNTVLQTKKGG